MKEKLLNDESHAVDTGPIFYKVNTYVKLTITEGQVALNWKLHNEFEEIAAAELSLTI